MSNRNFCLVVAVFVILLGSESFGQRGWTNEEDFDSDESQQSTTSTTNLSSKRPDGSPAPATTTSGGGSISKSDLDAIKAIENRYKDIYSSSNVDLAIKAKLSRCEKYRATAAANCNIVSPQMMAMLGVAANIGGMAASSSSVKSKCEAAAAINTLSLGANGTLGAVCLSSASTCTSSSASYPESCRNMDDRSAERMEELKGWIVVNCHTLSSEEASGASGESLRAILAKKDKCLDAEGKLKIETAVNEKARKLAADCAGYETNSYQYIMQSLASAAAVAQSATCIKAASDAADLPNKYATGQACDDPLRRQTPDCICKDPIQLQQNSLCAGYQPGSTGGIGGLPTAGVGGKAGANPLDDLKKPFGKVGADGAGTQTRNEGMGGAAGGGPQALNAGGINPEDGGGAAPEYKTDIDQGYQRSRGGGEGGSMFGGSRGGSYLNGGGAEKKPGFDLSKYMPWMKKKEGPERQIAEVNKLKADGVTGANGPSIWEKVSNRMRAIRGRLE
jgi:hypothetical protein